MSTLMSHSAYLKESSQGFRSQAVINHFMELAQDISVGSMYVYSTG